MDKNRGGVSMVGGASKRVSTTLTRPNDTNIYASGDAVTNSTSAPTVLTFANVARIKGGTGIISGAQLILGSNQATKPTGIELWLFKSSPTPDNDNAVFTPTDAELLDLLGIIAFDTPYVGDATVGAGGNAVMRPSLTPGLVFETGATLLDIYGLLVARNAYTPTAQETFTAILEVLQD